MKPASIIKFPKDSFEMVSKRLKDTKVFNLGGRKRKLVKVFGLVHYKENNQDKNEDWKEIDLTPVIKDNKITVEEAPYKLTIDKATISFKYVSKQRGSASFGLAKIGNTDFIAYTGEVRVDGAKIWWDNVALDTDIYLELKPGGVEFYKILRSDQAIREFTWNIEHDIDNDFSMQQETGGKDAEKRKIRMTNKIVNGKVDNRRKFYQLYEKFEGKTAVCKNKKTRVLEWDNIVNYPVIIDVDITENITGTGDDGQEKVYPSNTWQNAWQYSSTELIAGLGYSAAQPYHAGFRFQSIAVGQGDTIDLANLKLTITGTPGSPLTQIYGDDVDEAPAWGAASKPTTATKTTAKTAFAPTANGVNTIDVTAIIQELVNRGGWATGQDMRLFAWNTGTGNGEYWKAYDYNAAQAKAAILEIDFTEAVSGGVKDIIGPGIIPFSR